GAARAAERVHGGVLGPAGEPVVGAFVTFSRGDPAHRVTVWTDERGRFATPPLADPGPTALAVRRIGWKDLRQTDLALQNGQWLRRALRPPPEPRPGAAHGPPDPRDGPGARTVAETGERGERGAPCH